MLRFLSATTAIRLLASAAAASDPPYERIDKAYQVHLDCTFDAAMRLVDTEGTPEVLARKAVAMCVDTEKALGWRASYAAQTTTRRLVEILHSERKIPYFFRGNARSRPVADTLLNEPFPRMCASAGCGMSPTIDPKTKVWRPYRQQ